MNSETEHVDAVRRNSQGVVRERAKARTTSRYRGVTHHCRTRRWESHIWENSKQLYLGGFDSEHQAALVMLPSIACCTVNAGFAPPPCAAQTIIRLKDPTERKVVPGAGLRHRSLQVPRSRGRDEFQHPQL